MLSAERKIAALRPPTARTPALLRAAQRRAARSTRLARRCRQRVYITWGFIVVLRTHIYLFPYEK